MKISHPLAKDAGFSLIEVLIAFVIIMVGVLGFAKSQAVALSNTTISSTRSNAALQAASLAAAMHANKVYWATGSAPASMTVTGTVLSDATLNGNSAICTSVACTPSQLASFDLRTWGDVLQKQFSVGKGGVVCSTVTTVPITCTISISWQEKNVALNRAVTPAAPTPTTQTYTLIVIP